MSRLKTNYKIFNYYVPKCDPVSFRPEHSKNPDKISEFANHFVEKQGSFGAPYPHPKYQLFLNATQSHLDESSRKPRRNKKTDKKKEGKDYLEKMKR